MLSSLPESIGNLKRLHNVDISRTSISKLPESICNLDNLEVLDLKVCSGLSSLPESIGNLKHLRHVDISSTSISKLPESICNLDNLEVLNLKVCSGLSSLPESLGNLKHLRHVDISSTSISKLPESICNLDNLEVLDLSSCKMLSSLPESIGNLMRLHYVDISYTKINKLPESIFNLHNLQVLNLGCDELSSWPSNILDEINRLGKLTALEAIEVRGGKVTELADMSMLQELTIHSLEEVKRKEEAIQAKLGSKKHLRKLKLEWSRFHVGEQGMDEEVLECLQPETCIRELYIWNNMGAKPPSWPRDGSSWWSSSSVESVQLGGCDNWQVLPALGQLPCLKSLQIFAMDSLKDTGGQFQYSHGDAYFPSLEKLYLRNLPELVKWEIPWPPQEQQDDGDRDDQLAHHQLSVLPRLRELQIIGCPLLRQLPPLPPTLQKLEIERVGLTSLSTLSLQNLVEMKIEDCKDLVSSPEMKIEDCPTLSWLTSAPMKDALPSTSSSPLKSPQPPLALKLLRLDILRSSPGQIAVCLLHCPSLEELTIGSCPLLFLGDACDDTETNLEHALLKLAPTLRKLAFKWCDNLGSLPSKLKCLSSLKSLEIVLCPTLECLPSAGLPESLENLIIFNCPKLSERCKQGGPDWPLVRRIPRLRLLNEER